MIDDGKRDKKFDNIDARIKQQRLGNQDN